ncbi:MAG: 4Fe-4S binding protein [Candidatus Aureabacteria bacterium]|nr:4Fe-4S binding protein [Candidatus Auribacterota bacterium]
MISFNVDKCTGCGVCPKVCPHGVITIKDGKAEPVNIDKCIECGACKLNCEFDAIDVTVGTGCLSAIIKEDILKSKVKGCGCGDGCC